MKAGPGSSTGLMVWVDQSNEDEEGLMLKAYCGFRNICSYDSTKSMP